MFYKREKKNI